MKELEVILDAEILVGAETGAVRAKDTKDAWSRILACSFAYHLQAFQ